MAMIALAFAARAQSSGLFFPKGTNLTSLMSISDSALGSSEQEILMATLNRAEKESRCHVLQAIEALRPRGRRIGELQPRALRLDRFADCVPNGRGEIGGGLQLVMAPRPRCC